VIQLPAELTDADWLISPSTEINANFAVQFTATDFVEVAVGLDERIATVPTWLNSWLASDQRCTIGQQIYKIYRHRFDAGARIELGSNGSLAGGGAAATYVVFIRGVRPPATYPASDPFLAQVGDHLTWTIHVGVGDRYGFVIPYQNAGVTESALQYELLDDVGAVLCSDTVHCAPGSAVARLRTCTSINAGTYRVRLTHANGPAVTVGALTVE
jgi:hypothetical protein